MRLFPLFLSVIALLSNVVYAQNFSQDDVIQRLKDGNARFQKNELTNCFDIEKAKKEAKEIHMPIAGILCCSDARVGPEIVFDQGIGELFVVRVAGNTLSDHAIGSLEYAVQYLGAPVILVLGHTNCGAIKAFLETVQKGAFLTGYIESLVLSIYPAIKKVKDISSITPNEMVVANVNNVKEQLSIRSPVISERMNRGQVKIITGVYDLETGKVTFLDDANPQSNGSK